MPQEFQVVILAGGGGSRMHPLTDEIPKALLPISNRPLLSYQLDLLESAGFTHAIIVTNDQHAPKLNKFMHELYKGKVTAEFVVFKENHETADVLYRIRDKIKTDFIVMSCDLIVDPGFIPQMVDMHKSREAAVTMLIKHPTEQPVRVPAKPGASKANEQTFDYIALDSKKERVLLMTSSADVDEAFVVSKSLLKRYPHMRIHSTLQDAHFYIFSKWVLEVLGEQNKNNVKKKILSIKGDLVPYLISCQSSKRKQQELPPSASEVQQPLALSMSTTRTDDNLQQQQQLQQQYSYQQQHQQPSLLRTSTLTSLTDIYRTPSKQAVQETVTSNEPHIGCHTYVMTAGYCMRANTLQSYMEMNRDIARVASKFLPWEAKGKNNFVAESAAVHPQTQIGADCVVGASSKIGERCSVKKSIIGKHCQIGDNVKITNSILMDYCIIGNNCNITESIICDNVVMKEQCNIKDSQIGVGYFLASKSDIKNETVSGKKDRSK